MVMTLTGMNRLIGLPVIRDGRQIGSIVRGVLKTDGRALSGLVLRDGLRASRWLDAAQIDTLGHLAVICQARPARLPRFAAYKLFRVTDADGARIGIVTDALLDESTLKVMALEISSGPLDDLIDGRFFATAFDVRAHGNTGHVTIPCRPH